MIDSTWSWRQLAPATSPGIRYAHGMAWDGARVVVFGGWETTGPSVLGDMWELVGDEWNELFPATDPGARQFTHIVWDGSRFLMYGGFGGAALEDLWEYAGGDWNELFPANTPTVGWNVFASQLVWDGSRALILIPNATAGPDTVLWQYAAADWSQANPTDEYGAAAVPPSPRSRRWMPLVWAGDRLVAGGGEWNTGQSFHDTEEYAGVTWVETVVDGAPGMWSHRSRMQMVWTGDEVFMFGGMTGTVGTLGEPVSQESWVYDTATSTWTDLTSSLGGTPPPARQHYGMVWDGTRVIVFAGLGVNGGTAKNDTWVLEPAAAPAEAYLNHVFGLGR